MLRCNQVHLCVITSRRIACLPMFHFMFCWCVSNVLFASWIEQFWMQCCDFDRCLMGFAGNCKHENSFGFQACAQHIKMWDPLVARSSVMALSWEQHGHVCSELCRVPVKMYASAGLWAVIFWVLRAEQCPDLQFRCHCSCRPHQHLLMSFVCECGLHEYCVLVMSICRMRSPCIPKRCILIPSVCTFSM